MMTELRDTNRAMFWRILRRLLGANRGRLFVMLLALGAGAAVTAALLNLQVDAKRRLTTEFRAFGANVVISPRQPPQGLEIGNTLDESALNRIPQMPESSHVSSAGLLYAVMPVSVGSRRNPLLPRSPGESLVVAGYSTDSFRALLVARPLESS